MRFAPALVVPLAIASLLATEARAAPKHDITGEDYRLFCGYMDALENPRVAKLKGKRRDNKIARMAKLPRRKLMKAVDKVKKHGATCDEVGKKIEAESKRALDEAMPGRVDLYMLDISDPSHVVASVRWRGANKKKLVQEASLIALTLGQSAPIAKTIALRGVNPSHPDRTSDAAIWFEARTSPERTSRIDKARISDFADSRYIRVFDGVKCGKMVADPTQLGYRRGPCEGKGN